MTPRRRRGDHVSHWLGPLAHCTAWQRCTSRDFFNPLDSKGSYSVTSNNTVIHTLAVDGLAVVTFGTARRVLGGAAVPSSLYQM